MEKTTKNILIFGGLSLAGILVYKMVKGGGAKNKQLVITPTPTPSPNGGGGGGTGDLSPQDETKSKAIANDLFEAMNTCGTYDDKLMTAIGQINSNAMFDAVVRNYGTRTISSEWYCFFNSDITGDLSTCLRSDVSYIDKINDVLQANGVTKTL